MTILLAPSGPFVVSAASHRGGRLNLRLGHRTGPRDLRKDLTKQLTPARRPHRTLIPFTPSKTNQLHEAARFPANARVKRKLTQNVNAQKSRSVTRSQDQIHEQRRRVQASLDECYLIEVDGKPKSGGYQIFVEALIAGLQLKQQLPHCKIRVRDASERMY